MNEREIIAGQFHRSKWKMNEKIEKLFRLLKDFIDKEKSLQISINLHKGDLSEKVEIKESIKL